MLKKSPYEGKTTWQKVWYFIWDDDSIWSWIVNIIIAFVLIKFIVYPGLGLMLGTTHPIVAVVSGSMEHHGSFDDWWVSQAACGRTPCRQADWYINNNITEADFQEFPFKNGFNTGDIMILRSSDEVSVGDVIVFQSNRPDPIIHRVIRIWDVDGEMHFQTKGDANIASSLAIGEYDIPDDRVIGKAWIRVPLLGWIKIGFVNLIQLFTG